MKNITITVQLEVEDTNETPVALLVELVREAVASELDEGTDRDVCDGITITEVWA